MKMSYNDAIEFIKEHPQFKLKLPTWQDKYIKWEWSSYTEVGAIPTRLVMCESDKEPVEFIANDAALKNQSWVITTS